MFPPVLVCNMAALTIAAIYYAWRDLYSKKYIPERKLRERVAYMLWKAAELSR